MNDFDYREQKKGYIMDESYNGEILNYDGSTVAW